MSIKSPTTASWRAGPSRSSGNPWAQAQCDLHCSDLARLFRAPTGGLLDAVEEGRLAQLSPEVATRPAACARLAPLPLARPRLRLGWVFIGIQLNAQFRAVGTPCVLVQRAN